MQTRQRFCTLFISTMIALSLFSPGAFSVSYAHSFVSFYPNEQSTTPEDLYNQVNLIPTWWHKDTCDSNHYNNSKNNPYHVPAAPLDPTGKNNYRGLIACGPMPFYGGPDVPVKFYQGKQSPDFEWECTELVKRYLYLAFGAPQTDGTYGYQIVAHYQSPLLQAYPNNGTPYVIPVTGDVLSYNEYVPKDGGHTAIVTGSTITDPSQGQGTVTVLDENNGNDLQGVGTLQIGPPNNPPWVVGTQSELGAVSGWLHPKTIVANPPNPSGIINSTFNAVTIGNGSNQVGNVWAVGYSTLTSGITQTLIEHWDGSKWTIISSPNLGTGDNYLTGVADLSTPQQTSVWAVGYYIDSTGTAQTLFENWKGSSWTASSQGPGLLNAITRVSATEAWAVGNDDNSLHPVMSHLVNGTWTTVTDTTKTMLLDAVSAHASNDVWAVGETALSPSKTATLQWNGSLWTPVTSPSPGSTYNHLYGVTAITSNDVWAVGVSGSPSGGTAFIMQGTGSGKKFAWGTPILLNIGTGSVLSAVEALSSNNIWAVGTYYNPYPNPLVYHYDGSGWSQITNPSGVGLSSLTINPANGNVWIVGGQGSNTLTEFFN